MLEDRIQNSRGDAHEMARRKKAGAILRILRDTYGRRHPDRHLAPTDSLIATILSQHTSDRNSHAAFVALQRRYGTWEEVARAPAAELADVIRSAGLANIKADRILAALRSVKDAHGTYDLGFLIDLPLETGTQILRSLPGVGPKTAACVLLFACDKPAMPVDTHVHRVASRLGLIGPRDSAQRAHDLLADLVSPDDVYDFHVDLIAHGRRICQARKPRCEACPLHAHCDYFYNRVLDPMRGTA